MVWGLLSVTIGGKPLSFALAKIIRTHFLLEMGSDYSGLVRVKGVEPLRISPQEPKSCASANSAIPAYLLYYYVFASPVNLRY